MARKARNYKAEYQRRIARAAAAGKSRQEGRGHKPREHVERARRTEQKFGASPSTLTRLRKEAMQHVRSVFDAIRKHVFNEAYFRRGFQLIHADDLRIIIEMDPMDIISYVKIGAGNKGEGLGAIDLAQIAEYTPYSVDYIEAADRNPFWYH